MEKPYHCLQPRLLLSPAPTCCMSRNLMYVSGFSDADENQPTHTRNRTLRQTSPFSALFASKDLSFFFSICCLYYFLQLQTSNAVFPQVASAFPAEDDAAEAWSGNEHVEAGAERFYFQISPWHRAMPISHSPVPQFLHLITGDSMLSGSGKSHVGT